MSFEQYNLVILVLKLRAIIRCYKFVTFTHLKHGNYRWLI